MARVALFVSLTVALLSTYTANGAPHSGANADASISSPDIEVSYDALSHRIFEIGDNVLDAFEANTPQFKTPGPTILPIPEGTIDFWKYRASTTERDVKFLVVNDRHVVGVLQHVSGQDVILIDQDGDGTLDYSSDILRVPYWVVARTGSATAGAPDNVGPFLDRAFAHFNGDANPYASGAHDDLLASLISAVSDASLPNRDVLYALFEYYRLGNRHPRMALYNLRYVILNYVERLGADHPIFYLHSVETFLNMGYPGDAVEPMNELVRRWPDFVPGLVYQWTLESDREEKTRLYRALKDAHPNHWIVVQI